MFLHETLFLISMKSVRIFSDPEAMAEEMARCLGEQASQAASNQRLYSIALSGGSQDPVLYGQLAKPDWQNRIPWKSVHIFFADERCVPPDNEESNFKIVSHFLLNHIPIPKDNIHRIRGEGDPAAESIRYAKEIHNHMKWRNGSSNFFDWIFLRVGTDGHTASLFSGHDSLNSPNLCDMVRHPQTAQIRITLTPSAIRQSHRITYHVIGKEKAKIIAEIFSKTGKKNNYPAAQLSGEWFLDSDAASSLSPRP